MENFDYLKDENFVALKNMINEKLDCNKIVKIYKGKDEHCRCGCGGTYREDPAKFKRLVGNALRALENLKEFGDQKTRDRFEVCLHESEGWINIPIYNDFNPRYNQCYTIYFKI